MPTRLFGIKDSPANACYPKMIGGFLDLGPNHCLDDCERVDEKEFPAATVVRRVLEIATKKREGQLDRWFCNHKIGRHKAKPSSLKLKLSQGRLPWAIHVYSRKYYNKRVMPHTIVEAKKRGLPPNDLRLIQEMTARIWKKETDEIKEEIAEDVEKEKESVVAWRNDTLDAPKLMDEEKTAIINSLPSEFKSIFEQLHKWIGWGVVIIAGGEDPRTGKVRTTGYNFGCELPDGKDFMKYFNEAAASGYIPGTTPGERQNFAEYYGVPFMYHMKNVVRNKASTVTQEEITAMIDSLDPESDAEMAGVSTPILSSSANTVSSQSDIADNMDTTPDPEPAPISPSLTSPSVSAPVTQEHNSLQSVLALSTALPAAQHVSSLDSSTPFPQTSFNVSTNISGGADEPPSFSGGMMYDDASYQNIFSWSNPVPTGSADDVVMAEPDLSSAISGLPGLYGISIDLPPSDSSFSATFDMKSWLEALLPEQNPSLRKHFLGRF
ncbi:uncharacterized protein EV420DRAFT_1697889 [Desarmillaria tabescens]|uniref:Uncharacterized protein n=1 Tax=Armillaria tabescens TaxID=1929756 RepID=A0AA39K1T4_ARMTA|nr:uncharacterized protein EV420DRAFT_1697889 [Desarmillaria tabescens]KAK0453021.1 hypothetical protein EV420DRAFT_1697889 [Desarmillaria tabescens]